ncbi:amino acid ABC transporter permease [Streptosporangium sp. NPDC002544]|uniref:amino acid ABC transporter permease n=1 Tax=unclassified Streptosporangium TaxID=2632669 RepID=UPI00331667A3
MTSTERTTAAAVPGPGRLAGLERVPLRHYGRWISAAVVLALIALVGMAFAQGGIEWSVVGRYLTAEAILHGLGNTIVITLASMALAIVLGVVVAVMRMSANPVMRSVAFGYIWLFRGIPVLLQLLIWYNLALVFPTIGFGGFQVRMIDVMTPFMAALLGLGLHMSAYTAELVRAGILSVDRGQIEAAQAISLTPGQIRHRVVLPQAMRVILPPLGNEFISTLKTSSLAAVISYGEILESAEFIYYANNRVIELLVVAAIWYLVVVSVLSVAQHFVEQRVGRGFQPSARRTGRSAGRAGKGDAA